MGAKVTVFSHSPSKENDAKSMGAEHFVLTKGDDWHKPLRKNFDLILNTVSADLDLDPYLSTLATDGT
jgi:uncharacterized zinc-type alcohol dehydrogenase-like protein